ncbi:MAG: glutathione S-transferase [Magnetovibrio sp.]|nr:glutathione S-transferase [Magnetovibrio sp.]|tara:strand:+ start:1069 stop:1737 length:669 start_codon:yes stop_codon:yes gene_type:complete
MKLSFIYLDFPFWRAEVGKIALHIGGVEFENKIISREEFQRVKANGQLDDGTIIPFHQFPCLLVDEIPIAQTAGIARFCGKLSGIYPENDALLAARIDQFLDFATDITVLVFNSGVDDDEVIRREKREELFRGELARKLQILEKNINDNSNWVIGSDLGLADIAIWRLMGWLSSGMVDGIPTTFLKGYKRIAQVCSAVDAHPKIQEWVTQTYPIDYVRGNYH